MVNKLKIGIITMFYNTTNYGGILQSYALTRVLRENNFQCEQIQYNQETAFSIPRRIKHKLVRLIKHIKNMRFKKQYRLISQRRRIVREETKLLVPHSKRVYTESNIRNSIPLYDVFITGSDQVWHGEWSAYFLSFVPEKKKKIAYAISAGKSVLSEDDKRRIAVYGKRFAAISVREQNTALQIQEILPEHKIETVLDPTLLLSVDVWNELASDREIQEDYIFCYFLDSASKLRKLAKEFSESKGMTIATIPHMQGYIEISDIGFGKYQMFDVTPQKFLGLIKHASYILTDSFHATVFSILFKKQFVSFGRPGRMEMNNRLENLVQLFQTQQNYFSDIIRVELQDLELIKNIDYNTTLSRFEEMKEKSLNFLLTNITMNCS